MSDTQTGKVVGIVLMLRRESPIELSYASLVLRELGTRTKVREEHSRQKNDKIHILRVNDWDELVTGTFSENAVASWVNFMLERNYEISQKDGKI